MNNEMSSYFEEPEFKKTLAKYEGMDTHHAPAYFDAGELTDIADYYASNGRRDDANKVIDFALKLHPNDIDALLFRAQSFADTGQLKKAHKVLDLIEDQTDLEVRFLRASLLKREDRLEEADQVYEEIMRDEDSDLGSLLDIIQGYTTRYKKEYAKKWIRYLKEVYDTRVLEKKNLDYMDVMYDYYLTFHKPKKAIPLLQAYLDKQPYSVDHWNDLARCYMEIDNVEEANEAIDFALAIDDKNVEALAMKSLCCQQSGNQQEAERYMQLMSEESSNQYKGFQTILVKTFIEMQDYDKAIEFIDCLLEHKEGLADYEMAELYAYAAICHASRGEEEKGSDSLRKAFETDSEDYEVYAAAAKYYLVKGMENEALGYVEQAFSKAQEDEKPFVLESFAEACFQVQRYSLAFLYFRQLDDDYPEQSQRSYFFLLYCSYAEKDIPAFMHYIAKIRLEDFDLYEALEEECDITCPDDKDFAALICKIKQQIDSGIINLEIYL